MIKADTAPAICDCFLSTLATCDPQQSFEEFSDEEVLHAACSQDKIGWIFTTEGKISKEWRKIQDTHYRYNRSRRTAKKWAAALVTQLLSLTHSQWMHCNGMLHERDSQGLKLKDAETLRLAIEEQFEIGLEGLLAKDRHYITRGKEAVFALLAGNKKAWLSSILIARKLYDDTATSEIAHMQVLMTHWLTQS